jgi:predicted dehydrogenase
MERKLGRRGFLGAAAALSAASWSRVLGANERVGVGCIGVGLIGRIHLRNFHALPDARIAAVCEAYTPRLQAALEITGAGPKAHGDFRRVLDDKDVDAVVVSTADHWHALMTMMACAAGKDVYVEKPLHLFVREGEWMRKVAARTGRIVQVGTQQRSAPHYRKARELLLGGAIGDLAGVQCNFFRNVMPGIGNPPDGPPPAGLDWDLMLGPAPWRPYNPNRGIYHFRWFWDTSGGQMTNLGHHSLDVVHWIYGLKAPKAAMSSGGRWFLKDNGEVPDTQDTILEYPGFNAVVQFREASAGAGATTMGALTFMGTKGTMTLGRDGFQVAPDRKTDPVNSFAKIIGGHPVGGPQPVPEPEGVFWTEGAEDKSGDWKAQYVGHARNFLDSVKSRKRPNSDLESSHEVSTACHLANLSLRTGRKIVWDAAAGDVVGDREASAMLERPYRAPWDAERKALLG